MDALHSVNVSLSAILILHPELISDTEGYLRLLCSLNFKTPIFAITDQPLKILDTDVFSDIFPTSTTPSQLLIKIQDAQKQRMLKTSGNYRLLSLDASLSSKPIRIGNEEILLTKTEKAILRYLICNYPRECKAEEIASVVYPEEKIPQPSCIRAHISGINKKCKPYTLKRPIVSSSTQGYVIDKFVL